MRRRRLPRMRRFAGWPEAAFDVLHHLDGDPSPSERELLRKDRERLVRHPMIELMQDVADADLAYDEFFVWGFRKMLWPWQRQVAVVRLRPGIELSASFDLDGLAVAGIGWFDTSEQLRRFRVAVDSDRSGRELTAIIQSLRKAGFDVGGGLLKRVPRGYSAEHSRAELLRHRTLVAERALGDQDWLHTPEAVERVLAAFDSLRPLTTWIDDHVSDGRPSAPVRP